MADQRIGIVGAGIGGLTAALAMLRRGQNVTVLEQAPELGEVGAGLTLTPNATRVLVDLGLGEVLADIADSPARQSVNHYQTDAVLVNTARGEDTRERYGAPYYQVHRADAHEFTGLEQNKDTVRLSFADGQELEFDAVVGADGIKSLVRQELMGEESPRFTGYVAWRGLVPIERLPENLIRPQSAVIIGTEKLVARYLIRHGKLLNYVAFARKSGWETESWTVHSEVSELLEEFSDFSDTVRTFLGATPPELCYKWALHDRDALPSWTRGRVTLLGDAAHPMLPFLGQGAVMAIEDGMVLARAFEIEADPTIAMQMYEDARRERTAMVQEQSRQMPLRFHAGARTGDYDENKHRNEEALGLFDYNPMQVAI
jgi:salicylate hydroxylase